MARGALVGARVTVEPNATNKALMMTVSIAGRTFTRPIAMPPIIGTKHYTPEFTFQYEGKSYTAQLDVPIRSVLEIGLLPRRGFSVGQISVIGGVKPA